MAIVEYRIKDPKAFKRLIALEKQASEIEAEIKQLREQLLKPVQKIGVVVIDGYKFEVATRNSWQYSEKVAELGAVVKARMAYESANNIASKTVTTTYLRMTEVNKKCQQ